MIDDSESTAQARDSSIGSDADSSRSDSTPSRDAIITVLKGIEDPELFIDIWFLGLIYSLDIQPEGKVKLQMTFTSPMCPAGPQLLDQVKTGVAAVPGVKEVEVELVFSPPWEPSDDVKAMLGLI